MNKGEQELFRRANIPSRYREFKDSDMSEKCWNFCNKIVKKWDKISRDAPVILIIGDEARKFMGAKVVYDIYDKFKKVSLMIELSDLIMKKDNMFNDKDTVFERAKKVDLLILEVNGDAVGIGNGWVFPKVIRYRYDWSKPTILLSSLKKSDLEIVIPDELKSIAMKVVFEIGENS